ncbi:MAG: alpha/beta hydrolase [Burkholderiaceae bacterium]|nr:alpha/beta hydrolase [Burkholderiaceae bacterium]
MIETFQAELPHGITLSCRACGPKDAPALLFLHGFPEAAFVWDELITALGSDFRCIAPNLRGYEHSSRPAEVEAYRAKHLMADLEALLKHQGVPQLEALIAHDWGGAVAWNMAVQRPQLMKRLIIINSPHPATFLRELQTNPAQQASSAYMTFLCRPDAEDLLRENDYARLWPFFSHDMGESGDPAWLTGAVKQQYREVWNLGLNGPLNFYRASPLRPPTATDQTVMSLQFPPEFVTVKLPTHVIWAEADIALPLVLIEGLEAFVPQLTLTRVPGASHWIVHEQPALVEAEIRRALTATADQ